jgi:hypothetical protein
MEQQMLMTAEVDSARLMRCVDDCERVHRACLRAALTYCLEQGGAHVEPPHLRSMLACADVSRATADAMLANYTSHETLCAACATACVECAESCDRVGDLDECADACRACAASCTQVAGLPGRRI